MPIDVVLAGPGLEPMLLARAVVRDVAGARVPVAAADDVVAMKILAGATLVPTARGAACYRRSVAEPKPSASLLAWLAPVLALVALVCLAWPLADTHTSYGSFFADHAGLTCFATVLAMAVVPAAYLTRRWSRRSVSLLAGVVGALVALAGVAVLAYSFVGGMAMGFL